MSTLSSAELAEIAAVASGFAAQHLPIRSMRDWFAEDPAAATDRVWKVLTDQDWMTIGLPESVGGGGLGVAAESAVFVEFGRRLTPGPLLGTLLAAHAATYAQEKDLAADLALGRRRGALLTGPYASGVRAGDVVLTWAGPVFELAWVTEAEQVPSLDPWNGLVAPLVGRSIAQVPGDLIAPRACLLAASLLDGIGEALRDMSAEHARTRQQFGRPIGAFQAVKHRCADMAITALACRAQLRFALDRAEGGHGDALFHAAAAFKLACGGALTAAAQTIQNLGGMGFTEEHDAHLYLKRAHLLSRSLDPAIVNGALLDPVRHEFI